MTFSELPDIDLPDNLPLLTQVADEDALPMLTEIVTEIIEETQQAEPSLCEADLQQLLRRFEAHLETAFTQKLCLHLEQLQRQAVEQAVNELKAELPELLRAALGTAENMPPLKT